MRKLLCIFIAFVVTSLTAIGQPKMTYHEFGELYRTEGLLSDIDSLLGATKQMCSFRFDDAPPVVAAYLERLDNKSSTPEKEKMEEIIPLMLDYVKRLESEHPDSDKTMIVQAELGYIGFTTGIDSLARYSIKANKNASSTGKSVLLSLYFSLDERRYARNPYVIFGDAMIQAGMPVYALVFYSQAFPLDIYSKKYLYDTTPENIYHRIRSSPCQIAYKSMLSYPLQMWRLAKAAKLIGDPVYADYLNEAFRGVVERVLNAYDAMDSERQAWLMELYGLMFLMLYANPDPAWAYDAALFIKGFTNTIKSDKFPGHDSAESARFDRPPMYHDGHMMVSRTYSDVVNALGKGEYAIEFLRVEPVGGKVAEYDALLLSHSSSKPLRVHLCGEDELKAALETPQSNLYGIESKTLFNLVWRPLLQHIPKGSFITYSPDGLLNMFALDLASDGKRRVAMMYSTHRVSSTREVCRNPTPDKNHDAVLYGGLQYEMTESEMLEHSARYRESPRTLLCGLEDIDRSGWAALPGSGKEVGEVAAILSSNGHQVRTLEGMEGTEESFKSLSGSSPMILHLATHGFYYAKGHEGDNWYYERLLLQGSKFGPLVRSGLVLAGGQRAWLGKQVPDNVEDGILLAEEIADLDLSGTKLLTLSACETALGDVTPEGVAGLQAAFKRAGVGTMLVSLWKVDDDATREFMTVFYRSLGETRLYGEAIQAARRHMQSSSKYSNPYYWAGFVIVD